MLDEGGIKAAMSLEEERIAEVDWQKLKSSAWKEGYREGIDKGTEEALQQGTETKKLTITTVLQLFNLFPIDFWVPRCQLFLWTKH